MVCKLIVHESCVAVTGWGADSGTTISRVLSAQDDDNEGLGDGAGSDDGSGAFM